MRARRLRVEARRAQVEVTLRRSGVRGTRYGASLSRGMGILLARLAGHAQEWLVCVVEPGTIRMTASAGTMARFTHDSSNELTLLTAESALLFPLFLLVPIFTRKFLFVARLAISIIARLLLWISLATARFMVPLTIPEEFPSMRSANQRAAHYRVKRKPEHADDARR